MPTAAELDLILKFSDKATTAAKAAFASVGTAAQAAASVPIRAFQAFEGAVNALNTAIRFTRRVLLEVTLALSPFLAAIAIAGQQNTVVAEQLDRVQRVVRQVASAIGESLLPVLRELVDLLEQNADAMVRAFDGMAIGVAAALPVIKEFFANLKFGAPIAGMIALGKSADESAAAAVRMAKALRGAREEAKNPVNQVGSGIATTIRQSAEALRNFGNLAKELTSNVITGLQGSFQGFFSSIITGAKSAKEAFRDFGLSVINMLVQLIAKIIATIIVAAILNALLPGFSAGAGAAAGTVRAVVGAVQLAPGVGGRGSGGGGGGGGFHTGGQVYHGGGEVQATLEQGEFVVNKRDAARNKRLLDRINSGQGGADASITNFFVIHTNDSASFRGQMSAHQDLIEGMIQRAVRRNNVPLRQSIALARGG